MFKPLQAWRDVFSLPIMVAGGPDKPRRTAGLWGAFGAARFGAPAVDISSGGEAALCGMNELLNRVVQLAATCGPLGTRGERARISAACRLRLRARGVATSGVGVRLAPSASARWPWTPAPVARPLFVA